MLLRPRSVNLYDIYNVVCGSHRAGEVALSLVINSRHVVLTVASLSLWLNLVWCVVDQGITRASSCSKLVTQFDAFIV